MSDDAPIVVPWEALSPAALTGVVQSFVLREGTDYGPVEFSLAQKVAQVTEQLRRGEATLWFDPQTSSVTLTLNPQRKGA